MAVMKTRSLPRLGPPGRRGTPPSQVGWQVARWVSWYNTTGLHSSIDYLAPIEIERRHRLATTVTTIPEVA